MQYTIAETAPWQKTVTVIVGVAEVNRVLNDLEARYRAYATDPDAVGQNARKAAQAKNDLETLIHCEARTQLVDRQIIAVLADINLVPVTQMDVRAGEYPQRDQSYTYVFSFYYLPDFPLPSYEGLLVEESVPSVKTDEVDAVLENIRRTTPIQIPVITPRTPRDGDVAVIDFEIREADGTPCENMCGTNIRIFVGDGGAMQPFEQALKTVPLGEARETLVTLPENFPESSLTGKTRNLYIKLHTLLERRPAALDDALACLVDPECTSLDMLRAAVREELRKRKAASARQEAELGLLEALMAQTCIPLPLGMVQRYRDAILADVQEHMAHAGTTLVAMGRDAAQLERDALPEAERLCQRQLLLQRIAQKEGIVVSDAEIHAHIKRHAARAAVPYPKVLAEYTESGHLLTLRDRLLADKVMSVLYSKAQVRREQAPTTHAATV